MSADDNRQRFHDLRPSKAKTVGQQLMANRPETRDEFAFETVSLQRLLNTFSADNVVTDSAAAASAIATGERTNNGMLSQRPDGTPLATLLEAARDKGMSTGIVTTNTVYDATPAAFATHGSFRSDADQIAKAMLAARIDVLLGGGRDRFLPKGQEGSKRGDAANLIDEAKKTGYAYISTRQELRAADTNKLLGLFNTGFLNYVIDRDKNRVDQVEPTLAEMTGKALTILSRNQKGFFLLVEGARIDHAAHAFDATGMTAEILAFNEAVKTALNFARKDKNTLVIVLADHETGGMSVTEPLRIDLLRKVQASPEYIAAQFQRDANKTFTESSIRDAFSRFAGINDLAADEVRFLQRASSEPALYKVGWEVGEIIARRANLGVISPEIRRASATGAHTANMVPIFTFGPRADTFGRNYHLADAGRTIAEAMRVTLGPRR